MLEAERLKEILEGYPDGAESVDVVGKGSLVATIVSESFRAQDEAIRQRHVWAYLQAQLGDGDLRRIEFIFTNAPGEDTSEAAA